MPCDSLESRAPNKAALQQRIGLALSPDAFLLGVVSRLSWQKGLDLLLECLPTIASEGMQLALLGEWRCRSAGRLSRGRKRQSWPDRRRHRL